MQQLKSVLLLFIMGIALFPWQLICAAHPFGHEHHEHDGLSPCELHSIAVQQEGQHILPPMECEHLSSQIDDYQIPQPEKIKPTFKLLAVIAILIDSIIIPEYECDYVPLPEARSNSDPSLTSISLRAPPFI